MGLTAIFQKRKKPSSLLKKPSSLTWREGKRQRLFRWGTLSMSWAACRGLASIPRVVRRVPVRARTRVHVCTHTPCFVLRGDAKRERRERVPVTCQCLEGRPHVARDVYLSLYVAREFSRPRAFGPSADLYSYLSDPRDDYVTDTLYRGEYRI